MSSSVHQRPSQRTPLPDDVTDPLLWRLALDVAAAHQPGPDGRCRNLQCANQTPPCTAARYAHRAMQLARTLRPASRPSPAPPPARGRARVPARGRFAGWFHPRTPSRLQPQSLLPRRLPAAVRAAS